jgi:hypothetical protein
MLKTLQIYGEMPELFKVLKNFLNIVRTSFAFLNGKLKPIVDFGILLIGAEDARSSKIHSGFLRGMFIRGRIFPSPAE